LAGGSFRFLLPASRFFTIWNTNMAKQQPTDRFKFSGLNDGQRKLAAGMQFAKPKTAFSADGKPKIKPSAAESEAKANRIEQLKKELTALKVVNSKQAKELASIKRKK